MKHLPVPVTMTVITKIWRKHNSIDDVKHGVKIPNSDKLVDNKNLFFMASLLISGLCSASIDDSIYSVVQLFAIIFVTILDTLKNLLAMNWLINIKAFQKSR